MTLSIGDKAQRTLIEKEEEKKDSKTVRRQRDNNELLRIVHAKKGELIGGGKRWEMSKHEL
jgi:hypothetical protein